MPFPTLELAAFALVLVANWPLHREMFPELRFVRWLHEVVLAGAMRMGHWIVLAAVWLLMPPAVDGQAWTLAAMTLLLHLGIAFGGLQRFLQACRLLAPAPERLHRIVAAAQSTLPARPRHVWVSPTPLANAYAFPTTGDLLFTRKLLEVLSDEEIAAVTAHELGHLGESRAVVAGRLLASLVLYPWIFLTPAVTSQSWLGVAAIALVSFGLLRFGRFLSQRMEKRADQIATGHQVAEGVYARALERLYAANHVPAVLPQKHKTHPDLYDRLVAAGAPPDYPRPAKPRRLGWSAWVPLIWLGIVLGLQLAQG